MAIIKYPISSGYMAHWGVPEGIRELLQNAVDTGAYTVSNTDTGIVITNEVSVDFTLDNLTLFGETTKHTSATIGKFGEGFKLALLILAKANIPHLVTVNKCKIFGSIVDNKFQMHITGKFDKPSLVTITIDSLEAQQYVQDLLLRRQEHSVIASTQHGDALLPGGKLYVNGLFICKTDFKYSYNFKSAVVQLDRDRKTVANFELGWNTSKLWAAQDVTDQLVDDIFTDVKDVEYISSNNPSRQLVDALHAHFLKLYGPGAVLADSATKAKALEHLFQKVVFTGSGGYYKMVTGHSSYAARVKDAPRVAPAAAVLEFVKDNEKHMRSKARQAAKLLLLTSTHW